MTERSMCTSISVNFGKTFLSSVPEDAQRRSVPLAEVQTIGYGKRGLRPEFASHFSLDKRSLLVSKLEDDYVELCSGKFIVVHCVSQKSKKRYKIKLVEKDHTDIPDPSEAVIQKIAAAETYFSVLGISSTATPREIKIAYRRKAFRVHPDKNSHPSAAKRWVLSTRPGNV